MHRYLSFQTLIRTGRVILSTEWFSPPFAKSMSSYYILGPKTGMVGRQVGNYSFAPMYVPKSMNHRNCSGLQAIPDLDNHDPYEMYQNFMCADKFGMRPRHDVVFVAAHIPMLAPSSET